MASANANESNETQPTTDRAAPPPLPLPLHLHVRAKEHISPPPPFSPDAFKRNGPAPEIERKVKAVTAADDERRQLKPPVVPCFFFFYGSLMDPEVLQAILQLPEMPVVKKGSISGFAVKMWGIYPTLVPSSGRKVFGTVWEVRDLQQFLRLAEYETKAYTWCRCDIELSYGDYLRECLTFCWAGTPTSNELQEGSFDLERYQKHFKPSVIRRPISEIQRACT